jgi:hypothetical protein
LESAAYSVICEHLQKPRNVGSRPQAQFFKTLLGRFLNAPGLDAGAADHQSLGLTVAQRPDALKVGVEAAFGHVVGMADAAAHDRFFSADCTHLGHGGTLLVTEIHNPFYIHQPHWKNQAFYVRRFVTPAG